MDTSKYGRKRKAMWRCLWKNRPKHEPRNGERMDGWIAAILAVSDPERGPHDDAVRTYLKRIGMKRSSMSTVKEDRKQASGTVKKRRRKHRRKTTSAAATD